MRQSAIGAAHVALAWAMAAIAALRAHAQAPCVAAVTARAPAVPWPAPLERMVAPAGTAPAIASTVPLRLALDRLARVANVRLSYSRELLPLDRPVCLDTTARPLGDLLTHLLAGTGTTAIPVAADQVVLAPAPASAGTPPVPVLERVVVTGSTSAAPARRLPYALDVVERQQLSPATSTPVTALLNGRVPGVWAWTQPPTALLTRYGSLRGASSFGVTAPKVFVDGIELANPLVVTELAPDRIERVEVIRGPQGAALYGADAISGVVNIVTRHDGGTNATARELTGARTATVRTGFGAAEGTFASRPALAQDHAVLLRTGAGAHTAGLSFTASTLGAYTPGAAARRLVASGDLRRMTAAGTLTATARLADAATTSPANPLLAGLVADSGIPDQRLRQITAGATFTRPTAGRWIHAITAGIDAYRLSGVGADVGTLSPALDSAQRAATGTAGRATLRASSAATVDLAPRLRATVTGIADYGLLGDATRDGDPTAGTRLPPALPAPGYGRHAWRGTTAAAPPGTTPPADALDTPRTVWLATTGVVGQATVAVDDALFITAGLRGERNDGFTAASRFAALPSVGVSYLRPVGRGVGLGGATVKLRGAYGRGLRPARTPARMSSWRGRGGIGSRLAGDLGPESQGGFETGLDLLAGGGRPGLPMVSASVTRFDQRASGLLQRVALPHGAKLRPDGTGPDGTTLSTPPTRIENVGVIDNRGWEFETTLQGGPVVVGATAALVDSRVRRTARGYTGELRAGDRTLQVPRQTFGAFATWRAGGWTATAHVARARDWINYDRLALARLPTDSQPTGAALRPFWLRYPGVTHLSASLGRDVTRGLGVVVNGANLLDRQQGEPDNTTVLPGRTLTAGVRLTF